MKYVCLGYLEPRKFENMSESERKQQNARSSDNIPGHGRVPVSDQPNRRGLSFR